MHRPPFDGACEQNAIKRANPMSLRCVVKTLPVQGRRWRAIVKSRLPLPAATPNISTRSHAPLVVQRAPVSVW